jgi:hypothetical protein
MDSPSYVRERMVISSAVGTSTLSFRYLTDEDGYEVTMECDGLLVATRGW